MDIHDIVSSLFHSDQKFYSKLILMADHIVEGANLLTDMISLEDEKFKQEEAFRQIQTLESECDKIMTEVFDQLNDSVITPIAKTDLHQLCDSLDDVMDCINASAKRIFLYQPETMNNRTMHMAELIIEDAKAIRKAFNDLPIIRHNPATALEMCNRLHDLEHEGDDVYGDFVQELFNSDIDAKEVIKIKEIMGNLENATDCAKKVGKTLKTIIVKYK